MPYVQSYRAYPNRPPPTPGKPYWYRFVHPDWFLDNLNIKAAKIIIRNWSASFSMLFLLTVKPAWAWTGSSAHLALIMTVVQTSGQVSVIGAFLANCVLCAFIVWGWVCGYIIPGYIANKYFYDSVTEADIMKDVVARGVCSASLPKKELVACMMDYCVHGNYMKAGPGVVYAIWVAVACSVCFWFKFRDPLTYGAGASTSFIAAAVAADSSMHLPWYAPKTIGAGMLKPMGIGLAANVVVAIIFFPFTSGYQFTTKLLRFQGAVVQTLEWQAGFLAQAKPSAPDTWLGFWKLEQCVNGLRSLGPVLRMSSGPIPLEFSYTRFTLAGYRSARITARRLTSQLTGLIMIFDSIEHLRKVIIEDKGADIEPIISEIHKKYAPVGIYETQHSVASVLRQSEKPVTLADLDETIQSLSDICGPMVLEQAGMMKVAIKWITTANDFRGWSWLPWLHKKCVLDQQAMALEISSAYEHFAKAAESFKEKRFAVTENTQSPYLLLQKTLYCGYVEEVNRTILFMVQKLMSFDTDHPTPHWITGIFKMAYLRFASISVFTSSADALVGNDANAEKITPLKAERDPDALPARHVGHRIGKKIRLYYARSRASSWLVPIKGALFCVAALTPALFTNTHYWYYKNRCYWAVVMTGMSVAEYAADNMFSAVNRIFHTFYAVVIGMVTWYISTGNGHGNPYGFMVAFGIVLLLMHFYREFWPPGVSPVPRLMLCIAMCLVVSISWLDGQNPGAVYVGYGFTAAWHRYVTVCVGIVIGMICCNFPHPKSGKKAVRLIVASVVGNTGHLFCQVMTFAAEKLKHPGLVVDALDDPFSDNIEMCVLKLMGAKRLSGVIKYEPDLSGPWPRKSYMELLALCSELVELYAHLYFVIKRLEDVETWLPEVIRCVGWDHPVLMSNFFSVVFMASTGLREGIGLPQMTPGHLYHEHAAVARQRLLDAKLQAPVNTPDSATFLSAVSIANKIYDRMDRILVVIKAIVGEQYSQHDHYLQKMLENMA